MIDESAAQASRDIVARAKALGADLAGIARVEDLKLSPSHRISDKLPGYDGVACKFVTGRRRAIVQWPTGAVSAVVLAIEHPADKAELDWWITSTSGGNTAGNKLLMAVVDELVDWLEQKMHIHSFKLPYHIEHGAIYMKDAAVLAGLGCIGKNNLLLTPQYGPRLRLRVMLTDADLPATGPTAFDPCVDCVMPCREACPQQAFAKPVYPGQDYGVKELPGRSGVYDRSACNQQMQKDLGNFEEVIGEGRETTGSLVRYCRECELACPVGKAC